jgi:MFS family permease
VLRRLSSIDVRRSPGPPSTRARRALTFFALEPSVSVAAGTMFLMGFGEHLWRRFLPKYMEALGAPPIAIGAYGSGQDLLDGLYQYPGGWVADRFGRRVALRLFVGTAAVGYVAYLIAPSWPWLFVGLALAMAWSSMASPSLFAVVGDALPPARRAMGFTVQAILRRLPIAVAPTLGGVLITLYGIQAGMRVGFTASIALALLALLLLSRMKLGLAGGPSAVDIRGVWRSFPRSLRWLLASDVLIRACEGMAGVFIVLYATNVVGVSSPRFGALIAVEMVTAMAIYVPAARMADRLGRKGFVVATFLAFSLFPLAVGVARSFGALVVAFIVGGLREIGEPSRKALIVDLSASEARARSVGLYYLVRSVAVAPAALVGGMLWMRSPATTFLAASLLGLGGTTLFALTVSERDA